MDEAKLSAVIEAVVKELLAAGVVAAAPGQPAAPPPPPAPVAVGIASTVVSAVSVGPALIIDLPDPTTPDQRYAPRVKNPKDAEGSVSYTHLLVFATSARSNSRPL